MHLAPRWLSHTSPTSCGPIAKGRLNFWGRPTEPNTEGLAAISGMAPGCAGVIGVVIAALLGLFVLIRLIKRMWELA